MKEELSTLASEKGTPNFIFDVFQHEFCFDISQHEVRWGVNGTIENIEQKIGQNTKKSRGIICNRNQKEHKK